MKKNLPAAVMFALARTGSMNAFFRSIMPRAVKIAAGKSRSWNVPHEGARQVARHQRQGQHMVIVNGFEIMQAIPSRDRA